ncbi:MAG: ABC transporter ATP-binding protein/permease [Gammaproteobacteria bacterium]|nr:ABC transporter ATP-binding protein/permease [Gammaproteobacteria bacterium]MBU1481675.1 ABC transporter ATP-binding protein/permease [Gammaproteobacteria bacterium]
MNTLLKLLSVFSPRERRNIYWLLSAIIVMAMLEMAGVASIMPFMALVADPGLIHRHAVLASMYSALGFSRDVAFLYFVGAVVLGVLVFNNLFSAFAQWFSLRVTSLCGHTLSERLFAEYLSQPYTFYLTRNSGDMANILFAEVNRLVAGVLLPSIEIVAKGAVILAILLLLLIIDPMMAVGVTIVMGGIYSLIFIAIRRHLTRIGRESIAAGSDRVRIANEAFGGIKELKILGNEENFVRRYDVPSRVLAEQQAASQALAKLPKYLLEMFAFGGVLLITLLLLGRQQALSQVLPVIAVYAFAGYRLLPAIQQTYSNIAVIRFNLPALEVVFRDAGPYSARLANTSDKTGETLVLKKSISFGNVTYQYPGAAAPSVAGLSLSIAANSTVAFVGPTGSGKTTTVDILLGLFEPLIGSLLVDGVAVDGKNLRAWQRNLGYVPQQIFLSDDTIARNIAFGFDSADIDSQAVENAARTARIHEFIVNELPQGYQTIVGERGIRLSGGQRQRIGIARALYRDPEVLVLDEATSALDGITESAIMDTLGQLAHKKTIIMIAHRISTVRACDRIFILEKGVLIAQGDYSELMRDSNLFRSLSQSGDLVEV